MKYKSKMGTYRIRNYDQIIETPVYWLWRPYIPCGKITIVQGDPGEGKTTMMLRIAADLTVGRQIPGGEVSQEPQNVVFQTAEDSLSDTIKPRLSEAGADCKRVFFLEPNDEKMLNLTDDRFEETIQKVDAKLLIIDPLQAFIPYDCDMNKVGRLRSAFFKLGKMAERTGCAVVIIGHMNKAIGSKGIYRGLGSIDITAMARSVLLIGRDRNNPEIRAIVPIKTSLAAEGSAYAFSMTKEKGFQWIGECDYSEEEILGAIKPNSKLAKAKNTLRTILSKGDVRSSEIYEKMDSLGISNRTVQTAKKEMQINTYKRGSVWYWSMISKKST